MKKFLIIFLALPLLFSSKVLYNSRNDRFLILGPIRTLADTVNCYTDIKYAKNNTWYVIPKETMMKKSNCFEKRGNNFRR